MALSDYFDAVFYINLDRRGDRREAIEAQLGAHGIEAERFSAVDDAENPERGCFMSHREVARMARDRGLSTYFVFEDDALLPEDFDERLDAGMPELPGDWDGVYLGAWYWTPATEKEEERRPVPVSGGWHRVFCAYLLVSYGLRVDGAPAASLAAAEFDPAVPADDFMVGLQLGGECRFYALMEASQVGADVIGFVGHDTSSPSDLAAGRDRRVTPARMQLEGDDWFHGRGCEPNHRKAVECWSKGAEAGGAQCMRNLAWAYSRGFGVSVDEARAAAWLSRAEEMEKAS